jgi:hypothetical protein
MVKRRQVQHKTSCAKAPLDELSRSAFLESHVFGASCTPVLGLTPTEESAETF